jgi:hypothetical protein
VAAWRALVAVVAAILRILDRHLMGVIDPFLPVMTDSFGAEKTADANPMECFALFSARRSQELTASV